MQFTAESRTFGSQGWLPVPHRRTAWLPVRRIRPALQLLAAWIAMHDGACLFGAVGAHRGHHDCSINRGFTVLALPGA